MNKDILEGQWEQVKGKLMQTWGKLTDDDLMKIRADRTKLSGCLQARYGYSKEQLEKAMKDFQSRMH